jgi:quercetin 2,3-dioxygenase
VGRGRDGAPVRGPIEQPATSPLYLDITLQSDAVCDLDLPEGHNAFVYVCEGMATVGAGEDADALSARELGVLGGGARLRLRGDAADTRLILVAGRPLGEPVARYGPFVMNTREEIMQAFTDYQEARF